MGYDYDTLYGDTPNALGTPTAVFTDFFNRLDAQNLRILDVGCGQGRDTLFIARLGHRVTGVDLSKNGIRDLLHAAAREDLAVEGTVADITTYMPEGTFDIILIDRTLHMLSPGPRHLVLLRLCDHVAAHGWLLIEDESANIDGFKRVLTDHPALWAPEVSKRGTLFMRRA